MYTRMPTSMCAHTHTTQTHNFLKREALVAGNTTLKAKHLFQSTGTCILIPSTTRSQRMAYI